MSLILFAHAARQQQAHYDSISHFSGGNELFPSAYFNLFPPFPDNDRVFVAMPFGRAFGLRWEHVIKPGIEAAGLIPHRVDLSRIADSIPLKILKDIGESRLVFADVTAENGMRNANVMYELGIAQAVRRPEEVIVFRSDSDALPFDIAPIFADSYHPDDGPGATEAAIEQIKTAIRRALESIELTKHLVVQRLVDSLDVPSFEVLASHVPPPFQAIPSQIRLGKAVNNARLLSGFSKLLAAGVLYTDLPDRVALFNAPEGTPLAQDIAFRVSRLGAAVMQEFNSRFYRGRTPIEALHEYRRYALSRVVATGKIQQAEADSALADAAAGDTTAITLLLSSDDDRST